MKLREIRLFEAIPAAGRSEATYSIDKMPDCKITMTDKGVVISHESGDVLIFPGNCKMAIPFVESGVPRFDVEVKKEVNPEKKVEVKKEVVEETTRPSVKMEEIKKEAEVKEEKKTHQFNVEVVEPFKKRVNRLEQKVGKKGK